MSGISVTDWLRESADRIRRKGVRDLLQSAYYAYAGALLSVTARYPIGTNVFERDWDLLVVLDACRVDALRRAPPSTGYSVTSTPFAPSAVRPSSGSR